MSTQLPRNVRPGDALCTLDDLEDPGTKAFNIVYDNGREVEIFVVRKAGHAYSYVNDCPHQHLSLNWKTDIFLNRPKTHIFCVMHAAEFIIETGEMIYGPICPGCHLIPVTITMVEGEISLPVDGLPGQTIPHGPQ